MPGRGHQHREEARQPVGRDQRRLVAGDGALRRERVHRLRARDARDRLHREARRRRARRAARSPRGRSAARGSRSSTTPPARAPRPPRRSACARGRRRRRPRTARRAATTVRAGLRVLRVGEAGRLRPRRARRDVEAGFREPPDRLGHERDPALAGAVSFGTPTLTETRTLRSPPAEQEGNRSSALEIEALWVRCSLPLSAALEAAGSVSARPLGPRQGLRGGPRATPRLGG